MQEFLVTLVPFIVMIALMYFTMIRPAKKEQQKKQDMLDGMKPGDAVITAGGLNGIIDEIDRTNGKVVIDCEGAYLTFELSSIRTVKQTVDSDGELLEDSNDSEEVEVEVEEDEQVAEAAVKA